MLVVVADRHPMFREILRGLVEQALPGACCLEAERMADLHDLMATGTGVGLLLVDQSLPDADGLVGLLRLSIAAPDVPVILFSPQEHPAVRFHALVCGAAAVIPKSQTREGMIADIRAVVGPETKATAPRRRFRPQAPAEERIDVLTMRERMVLEALIRGTSNKQIAFELQVSETTVKVHVSSLLRKLRVHSRTQVVIRTRRIDDGLRPGCIE